MARTKKRADGRYRVDLIVGHKDGKAIRKSFYSRISMSDAKRQRDEWMDAHEYGGEGVPTPKIDGGVTFDKWSEMWLASYKANMTPNTRDFYFYKAKAFADYVRNGIRYGDMQMQAFKPFHFSEYIASLSGMSRSTIRSSKTTLKQIFDAAKSNGLVKREVCADISDTVSAQRVKGTYEGHRALSRELIDLIGERYSGHDFGLFVMIMLFSGLRPGEVAGLQWEDVDFSENVLHVRQSRDLNHNEEKATKTEAGVRDVPLFAPLRKALKAAQGIHGYICTTATGLPLSATQTKRGCKSFKDYLERIINDVQFPECRRGVRNDMHGEEWRTIDFTLYDLRATFCTTLYDAGVDLKTAQKLMGHRDAATTMRIYTKLSDEREEQSTKKMDAFLSANYGF